MGFRINFLNNIGLIPFKTFIYDKTMVLVKIWYKEALLEHISFILCIPVYDTSFHSPKSDLVLTDPAWVCILWINIEWK